MVKITNDNCECQKGESGPNFKGPFLENDMDYETKFLCVFIVPTKDYSDELSLKSERVTWEFFRKLVDLTWTDPGRGLLLLLS